MIKILPGSYVDAHRVVALQATSSRTTGGKARLTVVLADALPLILDADTDNDAFAAMESAATAINSVLAFERKL